MKYLIIGDSLIDKYIYGIVHRQSPEDPSVSVVDYVNEEICLGGCLNVAANVRALSHKLKDEVYVSAIFSTFTSELLKEKGIAYDAVVLDHTGEPHKRELVKTRILDSESHRQFLRLDNRMMFAESDIQRYKNKCYYFNGTGFDAIIVSDYAKGTIDQFIIDKLNQVDCPVFIDTKNKDLSIWNNIKKAYIKINHKEWKDSTNSSTNHPLIVTRGKDGATLTMPLTRGMMLYPTEVVEHGNVIGSGDVFLSGLVVKFMETQNLSDAINYANKAATHSVRRFGNREVRRDELLD